MTIQENKREMNPEKLAGIEVEHRCLYRKYEGRLRALSKEVGCPVYVYENRRPVNNSIYCRHENLRLFVKHQQTGFGFGASCGWIFAGQDGYRIAFDGFVYSSRGKFYFFSDIYRQNFPEPLFTEGMFYWETTEEAFRQALQEFDEETINVQILGKKCRKPGSFLFSIVNKNGISGGPPEETLLGETPVDPSVEPPKKSPIALPEESPVELPVEPPEIRNSPPSEERS